MTDPEPQETPTAELRDKITQLRRERDAHQMDESDYVDTIMELVQQHVERTNKCKGCGKDTSYCANCERLWQT